MSEATSGYRIVTGSPRYALLSVQVDRRRLEEITREIRSIPGAMERIFPPALNAAADEMRTWLRREFAARLRVTRQKSIADRVVVWPKASRGSLTAGARVSLTRLTVASFPHRQTAYGVWWTVGDAAGGRIIPRSFSREGLTHYKTHLYQPTRLVWRRAKQGEKGFEKGRPTRAGDIVQRYPIKVLRGPSLAKVFSDDPAFQTRAEAHGGAVLEKKIASQVDRLVK